jgi:hypothetical protein
MGGMMIGSGGMEFFLWPGVLSASVVLLILALAYVVLFPSIKYSRSNEKQPASISVSSVDQDPMSIVMRVAKPDERAALKVLIDSGGLCLQKDLTYKAKISKLKTHRIVSRLAERGIIEVRKSGKTNEISVPAWLKARDSTGNREGSTR